MTPEPSVPRSGFKLPATALSIQRRIPRGLSSPLQWSETEGRPARSVDFGIGRDVTVARTGWRYVADSSAIRRRATDIRVLSGDDVRAAIRTWEFAVCPFGLDPGEYFDIMDAESDEAQDVAQITLACWADPFDCLTDFGDLLLVDYAWSPSKEREGVWAVALEAALPRLFHRSAALFAKAFPTEYAGNLPGRCPAREGFGRRRAAMYRRYGQLLGLSLLPGWPGSAGWMWRKLKPWVLDPRANSAEPYDFSDDYD